VLELHKVHALLSVHFPQKTKQESLQKELEKTEKIEEVYISKITLPAPFEVVVKNLQKLTPPTF